MNTKQRVHRRAPLAAALLLIAPWAWAQQSTAPVTTTAAPSQQADTINTAVTLPDVVVKGDATPQTFNDVKNSMSKLPADVRDIAQSITVLNKPLLESQGATSLASALRNVPGLTLGGAEGGQIGNNINLNGFSARTDIFLDGMRDRGQYYRDIFSLDSIEVLMGPSSMLFGRGSTGGVINQVSKQPSLNASTDVSASVTTNGLFRTTVDSNRPLSDTSAFRIAAMAQDGNASTRDQSQVQDFGLAPSFQIGYWYSDSNYIVCTFAAQPRYADYGVVALNGRPALSDRDTAYGFSNDRTVQDIASLSATLEHKFSPNLRLRNQTQFNYTGTDAQETSPHAIGTVGPAGFTATPNSSLPLSQLFIQQQSHDRHIHDDSIVNQTELTSNFQTASIGHTLLTGFELGHDNYNNQNYYRNGSCNGVAMNPAGSTSGYIACEPAVNPGNNDSPANVSTSLGNLATGTATTVAAYVNDTLQLSKQFKFVGGLRYDMFDANISNSINSSNTKSSTALATADQTVNYTSVRGGGIWQPSEAQSYYVSYSTSFNPSLEQLTSTTGLSQPLGPEKNKAYEVGGKWDPVNKNMSLNAAIFEITQYNSRSQNPDNTYTANGTIRARGLRTGASGQLATRWQVFAGYTYLDATIIDAIAMGTQGATPANTPKNSANLWSTYDFLPHWQVGGGLNYQAERYLNNTNTAQVGSYVRWDSMLSYRQPKYDVRLNLFNMFNKNYYDGLIQSDGGRAVPGSGRTAMVSVNFHLL